VIYDNYRNLLSHNTVLASENFLDIGNEKSSVFEIRNGCPYINLLPFLNKSKIVVPQFLSKAKKIVRNSKQMENILKKS